ncbi:MAG TPA: hypothetical protein VGA42_05015, partial [Gemmatimonadales bacterium]
MKDGKTAGRQDGKQDGRVAGRQDGSVMGRLAVILAAGVLLGTLPLAAQGRLYVTNQDDATVSVIDLATHQVVETIDFQKHGFTPNAKPH